VKNGKVILAFSSPYGSDGNECKEMNDHITRHGDGVKDVAFAVDDCRGIYEKAVSRGAKSVMKPTELKDEDGTVIVASL
jgi:4-hydroxyphenylpyruvate dioxygenase